MTLIPMNRFFHILLLHFQDIFAHRSRSFVWFLISLINPLVLIFFWRGSGKIDVTFTPTVITSYYLTLVVADAMLMSHIEDEVSTEDILEGRLMQYILRPFPYYWFKWFREVTYRLLQGAYGIILWLFFSMLFGNFLHITENPISFVFACIGFILGFFLSFTFKMILGITGFWIRDTQASYQLVDAIILVFAGYIVPLHLMPSTFASIANTLPFAYMIYYPIILFQGTLPLQQVVQIILTQTFWLIFMIWCYYFVWQRGLKKFSGVGQ